MVGDIYLFALYNADRLLSSTVSLSVYGQWNIIKVPPSYIPDLAQRNMRRNDGGEQKLSDRLTITQELYSQVMRVRERARNSWCTRARKSPLLSSSIYCNVLGGGIYVLEIYAANSQGYVWVGGVRRLMLWFL